MAFTRERLKQLCCRCGRINPDCHANSAHVVSLAFRRGMSTIETPPDERLPIRTYVAAYDDGLVRDAILRELDRADKSFLFTIVCRASVFWLTNSPVSCPKRG